MGAIAMAFLAAGCAGAIPSSNGGRAALKLMSSKDGQFLVDGHGHTLYLFEKDEGGESYCSGACAAVWPPFKTSSMPQASGSVDAAALGTIKRDDGGMQVSYHGHPLYFYAADASTPGRTKGEDLNQFGSAWYLVNAGGKPVEAESSSGSGSNGYSNSGSQSGGGGSKSYSNSGSQSGGGNSTSSSTGSRSGGGAWG
jgi:predicted lipoprotein with Yx(FWY)xxD motif